MKTLMYHISSPAEIVVLTVENVHAIKPDHKQLQEDQLIEYTHNSLFPGEPVSIYKANNSDMASIVVIRDINKLTPQSVDI